MDNQFHVRLIINKQTEILKLIFTTIFFFGIHLAIQGQQNFYKTIKEYYRVDPFAGSFSSFINALSSDSALLQKEIYKQTDSTGYLLKGEYKNFNPYDIKSLRVNMSFYEMNLNIDSLRKFMYYTYQLTSFFPDNVTTRNLVLKEYKKLGRKLRRDLFYSQKQTLKGYKQPLQNGKINTIEDGEITIFSNDNFAIEPIVISWQTIGDSKQLALSIILKLRQENNRAIPLGLMTSTPEPQVLIEW